MPIKVAKFGGSSLADAAQFKKVEAIIKADSDRKYIVPSAPGKRFSDDEKITDMLYACYDGVAAGGEFDAAFAPIRARFDGIIDELGLSLSLDGEYAEIKAKFAVRAGRDYAASRGEYLNSIILAELIGYPFVDAAEVVFFREDGSFDNKRSYKAVGDRLLSMETAVVPGFYGSMPDGSIKTFSRGGSDVSGSVVSRGVMADIYENWTDVSGFLVADPRIINNPAVIENITFRELRELSYMGATVLHADAVFPVRSAGIPINIKNTNSPSDPGTMIVPACDDGATGTITGIAGKKGFSIITIEKDMMNSEIGFARRALSVLEKNGLPFEHLPSGIDTMGIVVASSALNGNREQIIADISETVNPDHIGVVDGLALVAVVGRGMVNSKGIAARVMGAIASADINIRMLDQGSSELNIIVGVDDADFEKAVGAIYSGFFA